VVVGRGLVAGLLGAAAGLLGGALVFFWAPQASAEKIISTKGTVEFFRIRLFSMFNLPTICCSFESSFLRLRYRKGLEICKGFGYALPKFIPRKEFPSSRLPYPL
jgi:hypothetical protein